MAAIASESYNDAKPDYLRNESQMLNHLLALDGITRVLRVEGPRSESLQFFVKTLENTDQSDEKALLLKILSGEGGAVESQDQLFSQLNQMRREIDKKLLASIEEKNKKFFIPFSIPDPLELGI